MWGIRTLFYRGSFRQKVTWSDLESMWKRAKVYRWESSEQWQGKPEWHLSSLFEILGVCKASEFLIIPHRGATGPKLRAFQLRLCSGTGHAQKPHGLSIAALFLWGKYGNHPRTHDSGLCLGVEESGFLSAICQVIWKSQHLWALGMVGNCNSFFIQGNRGISWKWRSPSWSGGTVKQTQWVPPTRSRISSSGSSLENPACLRRWQPEAEQRHGK